MNSSLKQALRQSGAESRLARGPDGSRGFQTGWRGGQEEEETDLSVVSVAEEEEEDKEDTTEIEQLQDLSVTDED